MAICIERDLDRTVPHLDHHIFGGRAIAESLYYSWSKEFLEAGKKRLAGDTARQATSNEVKALCAEAHNLKEALVEQMLENRLLKKA